MRFRVSPTSDVPLEKLMEVPRYFLAGERFCEGRLASRRRLEALALAFLPERDANPYLEAILEPVHRMEQQRRKTPVQ